MEYPRLTATGKFTYRPNEDSQVTTVSRTLQEEPSSLLGGIKSLAGSFLGTTGQPGTKVSHANMKCTYLDEL